MGFALLILSFAASIESLWALVSSLLCAYEVLKQSTAAMMVAMPAIIFILLYLCLLI
jgi:hypothetical protein